MRLSFHTVYTEYDHQPLLVTLLLRGRFDCASPNYQMNTFMNHRFISAVVCVSRQLEYLARGPGLELLRDGRVRYTCISNTWMCLIFCMYAALHLPFMYVNYHYSVGPPVRLLCRPKHWSNDMEEFGDSASKRWQNETNSTTNDRPARASSMAIYQVIPRRSGWVLCARLFWAWILLERKD